MKNADTGPLIINDEASQKGAILAPADYLRDLAELKKLIETDPERRGVNSILNMKAKVEVKFMDCWKLKSRACRALEHQIDVITTGHFMDHVTTYISLETGYPVLITQPYCTERATPNTQLLEDLDCMVYVMHDWSWHYPTRTGLYMIEVDPCARKEITRYYRGGGWGLR